MCSSIKIFDENDGASYSQSSINLFYLYVSKMHSQLVKFIAAFKVATKVSWAEMAVHLSKGFFPRILIFSKLDIRSKICVLM